MKAGVYSVLYPTILLTVCAGPFHLALLTVDTGRLLMAGDLEVCPWQLADFEMEFLMQDHWAWRSWEMSLLLRRCLPQDSSIFRCESTSNYNKL